MRNESDASEKVGRGAFQPSAEQYRRAGPHGQTILRASPIYWHSELPPLDAEPIGEHVVEATSGRLPSTVAYGDKLWDQCYEDLMARARTRLEEEITRLEGSYAHVLNESVDSRRDGATGESWLHGTFTYMLYRQPAITATEARNLPSRAR